MTPSIQPQPTGSCQLNIGLSRRGHAPIAQSSPAECPEDALASLRRVGIFGEGRLIVIRARENCQQVGKRRKVCVIDRCVERLLHAMIARDEGWIYVSHRLGAFVGFPPVNGKARAPPHGPTVVGAWVREQAPRLGVCCLVRGGGAEFDGRSG